MPKLYKVQLCTEFVFRLRNLATYHTHQHTLYATIRACRMYESMKNPLCAFYWLTFQLFGNLIYVTKQFLCLFFIHSIEMQQLNTDKLIS